METGTVADLIPIESKTRTIQTCFQQCLYEVPNFQRPYSWTREQLEDFWVDVVLAKGDFFFGSTVTWVSTKRSLFNDTYSIIDGQQRLTTCAILLSVVRDALDKIAGSSKDIEVAKAAKSQSTTTQRYLLVSDDDGVEHRVLTRPEHMFYEKIQNPNAIPSSEKWNGSAKRIGEAREFFEEKILDGMARLNETGRVEQLKSIRANALKARVIQVELASEEDGFLVFETLNTRGADLRLSDLVKNLLIRGGARNSEDRKTIARRWDLLVEKIEATRSTSDVMDRFIWQSWNSRRDALKEPELFKAISQRVAGSPSAHVSILEELESDATTYRWLDNETVRTQPRVKGKRNAFSVPEFVDSVRALEIFNVSVANSTLLAVARKYCETNLMSQKQLIDVVGMVESFHFRFTALTNSGSTGGTRGRYNRFAVRLEEAGTKKDVADAIEDLRVRLRQSLPSERRTTESFLALFYAPRLKLTQAQKTSARKVLIAYVLMSFAKRRKLLPAGQDLDTWSIEHIKPQASLSGDIKDPGYSIGNLVLLTSGLNSDIGNSNLQEKIQALEAGSAYFDEKLKEWSDSGVQVPTDEQILERSEFLAREALDTIWNL